MLQLLATASVLALLSVPALAHGGQYKGPSDAAGATAGGSGQNAPPTNPAGAGAPGPGAPSSGGAAVTAGTKGGGNQQRNRGASDTGGGNLEFEQGYEIWQFWWENNKDQYLNLKNRLVRTNSATGSSGHFTGRGRKVDSNSSRRPSIELIQQEVIPTLAKLMASADDRDIIDSAILAMARSAQEASYDAVLSAALPLIKHKELSVQTSATLALGVLGAKAAIPTLNELVADTSKGQALAGGGSVNWLVRAFAALSLGLINEPESVPVLIDLARNTADKDRDLKVCAIVALGLVKNSETPAVSRFLVELLGDRKLDAVIKSYVPTSLGKLHSRNENYDPSVLQALLATFTDRDTDNFVLQSTAIALGLLGTLDNTDVVEALRGYIAEGKDIQTRHFAFIALAQIGARDRDTMQAHLEQHEALKKLFCDEITKPETKSNRSWAALAGAIYARSINAAEVAVVERLDKAYRDEKDPMFKSAFAVALGLLNVTTMKDQIFEDFKDRKEEEFKGYCAIAMGFMNHTDAAETLNAVCRNKTITPTYRLQVATGLGLMGDDQAVQTLVDTLMSAQTLGVSSAVAKALGLIGDEDAVAPLRAIAEDESIGVVTRAFACVALGIVCEKTPLPWNAAISQDNNYRARVPAIDEVLDIL